MCYNRNTMNIGELKSLLICRASHRKYLGDPVPREDIVEMADAARHAPSGHNLQPWKLIAISNRDLIRRMAELSTNEYAGLVEQLPDEVRDEYGKFGFYAGHFVSAPLVFVILSRKSEIDSVKIENLYGVKLPATRCFDLDSLGVGAFIQNLLLAAEALGYGTCWVAAPVMYAQAKMDELLGVEEPWHTVSLVSVTRPVRERKGAPKKNVDDILTIVS